MLLKSTHNRRMMYFCESIFVADAVMKRFGRTAGEAKIDANQKGTIFFQLLCNNHKFYNPFIVCFLFQIVGK
jgi:hypothetical protein